MEITSVKMDVGQGFFGVATMLRFVGVLHPGSLTLIIGPLDEKSYLSMPRWDIVSSEKRLPRTADVFALVKIGLHLQIVSG